MAHKKFGLPPPAKSGESDEARSRRLSAVTRQLQEVFSAVVAQVGADEAKRLWNAVLHGTLEEWAADCRWFTKDGAKRPNKSLAKRVSDRLRGDQLVTKEGRKLVLTPEGRAAAKGVAAR